MTSVRFLHTADLQLGRAFDAVPGDAGAKLRDLRLSAIARLITLARDRRCQFMVIAGDLFDANTVSERIVGQTLEHLRASPVPVFVIPGNHDHGGQTNSVLSRASFLNAKPDHLHVLTTTDPVRVDGVNAVLWPAPLMRRHVSGDPTAHLTHAALAQASPADVQIGLAHGSVTDFDFDRGTDEPAENLIDPARAETAGLDYLALGDWHGALRVNARTWYSGTPETDRFKDNASGFALVVDIDGRGAEPRVEQVPTGTARWIKHRCSLFGEADLDEFERWREGLTDPVHVVLDLEFDGVLSLEETESFHQSLARLRDSVLFLRETGRILPRPTARELEDLAPPGFLKDAVAELSGLARDDEASPHAGRALQILFEMVKRGGVRG